MPDSESSDPAPKRPDLILEHPETGAEVPLWGLPGKRHEVHWTREGKLVTLSYEEDHEDSGYNPQRGVRSDVVARLLLWSAASGRDPEHLWRESWEEWSEEASPELKLSREASGDVVLVWEGVRIVFDGETGARQGA